MHSRLKPLWHDRLVRLLSIALAVGLTAAPLRPALALSDIPPIPAPQQDPTAPQAPEEEEKLDELPDPGLTGIPDPDPLIKKPETQ